MTQFQILKSEFVRLLNKTVSVAGEKSTLEILSHVLLSWQSGKGLTVRASDLSVEVSVTSQEVILKKNTIGAITVPAKDLARMVKSLPDGEITLTYDDRLAVVISAGKSKFSLSGSDAVNFPVSVEIQSSEFLEVNPEALSTALSKTLFAASEDETRAHLNGVYVESNKDKTSFVATDGTRLALFHLPISLLERSAIVPRKACVEIVKLLNDKSEGSTLLRFDTSRIIVRKGATQLVAKQIDSQFPDYRQVLATKKAPIAVTVNRLEFKEAVNRLSQIGAQGIEMSVSQGLVRLAAKNNNKEASDELQAEVAGPALTIGFAPSLMLDIVSAASSLEIRLGLTDETSAIEIASCDEPEYQAVLMPMRI